MYKTSLFYTRNNKRYRNGYTKRKLQVDGKIMIKYDDDVEGDSDDFKHVIVLHINKNKVKD